MTPLIPLTNQLLRVRKMRVGNAESTGFIAQRDDSEFLVTALHAVKSMGPDDVLEVLNPKTGAWVKYPSLRFDRVDEIDLAFARISVPKLKEIALEIGAGGLTHGQEVFILGYPVSPSKEFGDYNNFPIALYGRVSFVGNLRDVGKKGLRGESFLVDRPLPAGMSGSPVCARTRAGEIRVVGLAKQTLRVPFEDWNEEVPRYEPHFTICSFLGPDFGKQ